MDQLMPEHKRTDDLRESAYELREALSALVIEHMVLSDIYEAMLQAGITKINYCHDGETPQAAAGLPKN